MVSHKYLFTKRRFLPLFVTQFLGAFNDNFLRYALGVLVSYKLVGTDLISLDPKLIIVLIAALLILPYILFSSLAGQLADKYERSRLIRYTKYFELCIALIAAYGFWHNDVSMLMLVVFMLGTQSSFFSPMKYSLLPDQLKKKELVAGNGFLEAGTFVSILAGTVLGTQLGDIIDLNDPIFSLYTSVTMISLALIGIVASHYIEEAKVGNAKLKLIKNPVKATAEIIGRVKADKLIFQAILGTSWFWMLAIIFQTNMISYAREVLYVDTDVATIFFILFSVGIAIGAMSCAKLLHDDITAKYAPSSLLGISVCTFLLVLGTPLSPHGTEQYFLSPMEYFYDFGGMLVALAIFSIAFFSGTYVVPLKAIIQKNAQARMRSRIIAGENIINALFMFVAGVVVMLLLYLGFSIMAIFLILAVLNLIVAFFAIAMLPDVLMQTMLRSLFKIFFRVEVVGLENFKKAGKRVVIMPNYQSFMDPPLLSAFLPEKPNFAISKRISERRFVKMFMFMYKVFRIDAGNPMTLKRLVDFVEKDNKVVIFPESRITETGSLMKMYQWPGAVADKADAMILPVRIEGTKFTYSSRMGGKVRRRLLPKIKITVMPPVKLEPKEKATKLRRAEVQRYIERMMSETMFEAVDHRQTLLAGTIAAAQNFGFNKEVLEDINRQKMTYRTMFLKILALGGIFKKILKGQNVGILLPNAIANVVTFFAVHYAGKTPAMINFSSGAKNINNACKMSEIQQIITSKLFIRKAELGELMDGINNVEILYLEDIAKKINPIAKIRALVLSRMPVYAFSDEVNTNPDSPAVIIFTSGSEGVPKGVVLSHANIFANVVQADAIIDISSREVLLNVLPMFHSFGLTVGTILPLVKGMNLFLYPSPLHYNVIPEIAYAIQATLICGTDTFFCKYAQAAHPYDFSSVRYAIAGAEKLKESTYRLWNDKFGIRIMQGYGVSETAPLISVNTKINHKFGSIGKIVPGMEHKLVPVEGIEEGGELWVKGPNVMLGYLKADKPGKIQPPKGGWHATGDIIKIDDEGFLHIMGRSKRFAKIAGEMVSLPAVEEVVNQAFPDTNSLIVTIRVKDKGERLVVVTEDKKIKLPDVVAAIKAADMPNVACPRRIYHCEIPVMGTGKTDYVQIQKTMQDMFGDAAE